ncbi:MAG TPA: amidohydrolase family protein [Pseudomonadales bacterium]|nr:amidohydrolase family protein [Pseudomonadales bacterium]
MSDRRANPFLLPILLVLAGLSACGEPAPSTSAPAGEAVDLVVTGARIRTGDVREPWADAMAVRDGRIVAIGAHDDVRRVVGDAAANLTLQGGLVVPGFIDAHEHFAWSGDGLASVQLRDAATREAFTDRIAAFADGLAPGEWVLNGAWDHENWGGELPTREWIDAVTPDNPVWVVRLDGHMGLANSAALAAAGVRVETLGVDGGEIVRDALGRPTGILKDNAMALVERAVPTPTEAQMDRRIRAAMDHVAARGVTTVHDMGDWASMATYRRLHAAGELKTRIYSVVPLADWERLAAEVERSGTGDDWLRIGGLKGFMDGSLGSHTAAFFEPYTDAPDDSGLLVNDPEDIERWVRGADAAGLQVMVHAIGDRAIAMLLDIYGRVAEANGPRDRRFRIEHAQHIAPDDIPRFAAQEIIASMQPYHAIDDGRWASRVIGPERAKTTYAFASLLNSGATVALGSDWPVAPPDVLEGIYAAATRRTLDGAHDPDGWIPEQRISVRQALDGYTAAGAFASFDEDIKGRLEVGMLADFVVLDEDITRVLPPDVREARVLYTYVGGREVYAAP